MSEWLDGADDVLAEAEKKSEKRAGATTWKPHTNDKHPKVLRGTLIDGDVANTEYGDTVVLTIEDKDDEVWIVWCGAALLKNAVEDNKPAIGKGIVIKEDGLRQPKNPGGREYRMYTMAVEESDPEYWAGRWVALRSRQDEAAAGYSGSGETSDSLEAPY